jgi:signal peptidase I
VQRGSIIAFHGPASWSLGSPKTFVSRVIAVGGDHITCDGNRPIMLNGQSLSEDYLFPGDAPSAVSFDVTVPPGRVFVLGDHRSPSLDSRAHDDHDGTIAVSDVIGVVTRILEPPSRAGLVPTRT